MRPVVYSLTASLDGYINREDGTLDWISMDPGVPPEQFFREKFSSFDAVIIGRKSYDTMRAMPGGGAYPGMKNYVVSRTIAPGQRDGFEFISGDLKTWVEKLRNAPGKKIGSAAEANWRGVFWKPAWWMKSKSPFSRFSSGKACRCFPGLFPNRS